MPDTSFSPRPANLFQMPPGNLSLGPCACRFAVIDHCLVSKDNNLGILLPPLPSSNAILTGKTRRYQEKDENRQVKTRVDNRKVTSYAHRSPSPTIGLGAPINVTRPSRCVCRSSDYGGEGNFTPAVNTRTENVDKLREVSPYSLVSANY